MKKTKLAGVLGLLVCTLLVRMTVAQQSVEWLTFSPGAGLDKGKHIVLIAGDESYRSEESMPVLGKLLAERHGFRTTVLFPINPETKHIDPDYLQNIPGLEALSSADLMIIATRFRELPDDQMRHIDQYLKAARPVIGLRTATHAFYYNRNPDNQYARYGFNNKSEGWEGGFGKRVLGETWVSHHGATGKEGTRGLIDGVAAGQKHPVLRGVADIWGITDVYGVKSLPEDARVLVWGQTTKGIAADSPGMWEKSVMPLAWIQSYSVGSQEKGKVFTTTMGAASDFLVEDFRRMMINACYWATGIEDKMPETVNADLVGKYEPSMYGFGGYRKGKKPEDYQ